MEPPELHGISVFDQETAVPSATAELEVLEMRWLDAGYSYQVTSTTSSDEISLNVSRQLVAGRGSPLAGRRRFLATDTATLMAILTAEGPVRTGLVDDIIQGGPISVDRLVASVVQPEFWFPL